MGDERYNPWIEARLSEEVAALGKFVDSLLLHGCPPEQVEALVDEWVAERSPTPEEPTR